MNQNKRDLLEELIKQQKELNRQISELRIDIMVSRPLLLNSANIKRNFLKSCPTVDCRGFLNSDWKCLLCNTTVCSKCHEIDLLDKSIDQTVITGSL